MAPELRKRKAPVAPPVPAPAPKKTTAGRAKKAEKAKEGKPKDELKKAAPKKKEEEKKKPAEDKKEEEKKEEEKKKEEKKPAEEKKEEEEEKKEEKAVEDKVAVGQVIALEGFGGEVETHDGEKTTLKKLLDKSKAGVVLFTYPKASTPGCTNQACLFRDSHGPLTAGGLAIYGLSADSPKANTTFKEKQKLPYPLLCDPQATLIAAVGLKKTPKGTQRGVFVVDKKGKVLVAEPGSPAGTVERVKALVEELKE